MKSNYLLNDIEISPDNNKILPDNLNVRNILYLIFYQKQIRQITILAIIIIYVIQV